MSRDEAEAALYSWALERGIVGPDGLTARLPSRGDRNRSAVTTPPKLDSTARHVGRWVAGGWRVRLR